MAHYTQKLENKYPEINELLALKDSFCRLVLRDKTIPNRKMLGLQNPVRSFINVFQAELRSHIIVWLFIWGIADGFRYLLNPLGIPNYF